MRISDWSSDVCSSDLYAHSMAALMAATIMATPALAQSAPEPTPSSQATAKTFTEAEISNFAKAAVEVNQIEKNAAVSEADKPAQMTAARSEERRVGHECVSTVRSRWSRYH